jgi:CheY-like chemotaxis protein
MMKKILIIDDNKDILVMFEQLLLDEGFSVSTANNGIAGIELFKRENFDLVITDIYMPGISGLDVVESIRNDIMKVPIILMSSDYLPVDPDDVKKLGINAIISKTINDYDFCELIKHCLEDKVYESKIF